MIPVSTQREGDRSVLVLVTAEALFVQRRLEKMKLRPAHDKNVQWSTTMVSIKFQGRWVNGMRLRRNSSWRTAPTPAPTAGICRNGASPPLCVQLISARHACLNTGSHGLRCESDETPPSKHLGASLHQRAKLEARLEAR
jgi:hypothetical protein